VTARPLYMPYLIVPYCWGDCNHIGCSQRGGHIDFGQMHYPIRKGLACIFKHHTIALTFVSGVPRSSLGHARLRCCLRMMSNQHCWRQSTYATQGPVPSTGSLSYSPVQPADGPAALLSMLSLTSVAQTLEASLPASWSLTWLAQAYTPLIDLPHYVCHVRLSVTPIQANSTGVPQHRTAGHRWSSDVSAE